MILQVVNSQWFLFISQCFIRALTACLMKRCTQHTHKKKTTISAAWPWTWKKYHCESMWKLQYGWARALFALLQLCAYLESMNRPSKILGRIFFLILPVHGSTVCELTMIFIHIDQCFICVLAVFLIKHHTQAIEKATISAAWLWKWKNIIANQYDDHNIALTEALFALSQLHA